jgi:hypothetical protein
MNIYVHLYLSEFLEREMFRTKRVEEIKTHLYLYLYSVMVLSRNHKKQVDGI